jgi:ABC-type sugar transport system permease subunit
VRLTAPANTRRDAAMLRRQPDRRWLTQTANVVWVLPVFALLACVLAYPLVSGLMMSLRNTNGSTPGEFVGLNNYVEALTRDEIFRRAVGNTVAFTGVAIFLQTGVGLLLAILISEVRRGRLPYRMVFFAPVVLSSVAVGSVWKWMYAPYFGLFTNIAANLGLADVYSSLLASQATALWAIMAAFVWRWAGFNTVIYLAGLQSIPTEYYEAAMIEGAGGVRRFWHITWPLLLPQTYTVVLLTTMGTLRIFDLMWIMTEGGPAHATETVATYLYVTAFRFLRAGYAQSLAFILLGLVLVLTLLLTVTLRKRANEITG